MIAPMEVEAGKPITLTGYAEDYGKQIVAVEFSLDNGEHWTAHDVSDSREELWVHWTFTYTPKKPGTYRLMVRSVNADGEASPLPDVAEFFATAPEGMLVE